MSTKPEDVAPLAPILTQLIENSGIELGTMDLLQAGFAEMIGQYGVNLQDVRVTRTLLNAEEVNGNPNAEARYRYDAAFPDPHPDNNANLITLKDFLARDWDAPMYSRYADAPSRQVDQFGRATGSTKVTHDASEVFKNLEPEPQSVPAKRALAKKQEEEREALAAAARANRTQ